MSEQFLDDLNDEQRAAVENTEGYVRLHAGAGTGKTRTLTYRYAYLVSELGLSPRSVWCVTFTNKAAGEMRRRIIDLCGNIGTPFVTTFHGFCATFLREEISIVNWPRSFTICDISDIRDMLRPLYKECGIEPRTLTLRRAKDYIDSQKVIQPYLEPFVAYSSDELMQRSLLCTNANERLFWRFLYSQRASFSLDFADLILLTLYILKKFPAVRERWQSRLEYILVDEFQDIDPHQYELVSLLAGKNHNLFIVGDPDQTIYSFRGANTAFFTKFIQHQKNTLALLQESNQDEYFECHDLYLTKNYRTQEHILKAAFQLISHNKDVIRKPLMPMREDITLDHMFEVFDPIVLDNEYLSPHVKRYLDHDDFAKEINADVFVDEEGEPVSWNDEDEWLERYYGKTMINLLNDAPHAFNQQLNQNASTTEAYQGHYGKSEDDSFGIYDDYDDYGSLMQEALANKFGFLKENANAEVNEDNKVNEADKVNEANKVNATKALDCNKINQDNPKASSSTIASFNAVAPSNDSVSAHAITQLNHNLQDRLNSSSLNSIAQSNQDITQSLNTTSSSCPWEPDFSKIAHSKFHDLDKDKSESSSREYAPSPWQEQEERQAQHKMAVQDFLAQATTVYDVPSATKEAIDLQKADAGFEAKKDFLDKHKYLRRKHGRRSVFSMKPYVIHAPRDRVEASYLVEVISDIRLLDIDASIAILYRAHYIAEPVETALIKARIPYRVVGATLFFERKEIKDMVAYLRLRVNLDDDVAFRRIINTPPRGFGKKRMEVLANYARQDRCSLFRALLNHQEDKLLFSREQIKDFVKVMSELNQDSSLSPLDDFEMVLSNSGYEEWIKKNNEDERLENIAAFKNYLAEYLKEQDEEDHVTLADFLRSLALFTSSDDVKSGAEVQLMTVHNAKGLEFDYVFVIGLNEGIFPNKKSFTEQDIAEERRLMYVAMTRAKKQLFLSEAGGSIILEGNRIERICSRFLEEIPADYIVELGGHSHFKTKNKAKLSKANKGGQSSFEADAQEMDRLAEQAKAQSNNDGLFKEGDRVFQKVFGLGTIQKVNKEESEYSIFFDKLKKVRTLSFSAKLERR